LLQGAAKNMIERGEKLGISQAVRDAVGEIRRNVQDFQQSRISTTRGGRSLFGEAGLPSPDYALTITLMEKRNRRLAAMLDESVTNLKLLAASELQGEKEKNLETVEVAAAKIQFVKACLEDPSLALPEEELPPLSTLTISNPTEVSLPTVALDTTPVVMTSSAVEETRTALSSPESGKTSSSLPSPPKESQTREETETLDKMDTDIHGDGDTLPPLQSEVKSGSPPVPTVLPQSQVLVTPMAQRPQGPIPTRSTLAQSSFAWMLEPDTTSSSLPRPSPFSPPSGRPPSSSGGASGGQKKRHNPSRERNAFLFGEVTADCAGEAALSANQIFGLQPIRKGG
jgi:TBC1 domain family protein 5